MKADDFQIHWGEYAEGFRKRCSCFSNQRHWDSKSNFLQVLELKERVQNNVLTCNYKFCKNK